MARPKKVHIASLSFKAHGSWIGILPKKLADKWDLDEERGTYDWVWEPVGYRKALVEIHEVEEGLNPRRRGENQEGGRND